MISFNILSRAGALAVVLLALLLALPGCPAPTDSTTKPAASKAASRPDKDVFTKAKQDVERFEQALVKSPGDKPITENLIVSILRLSDLHQKKGQFKQAQNLYRRILELDAENAQALRSLGIAQFQYGEQTEAISTLEKLLKMRPKDYQAHNYLGQIRSARGELEPARDAFLEALKEKPASGQANKGLMLTYKKMGLADQADIIEKRLEQIKKFTYFPDRGQEEKLGREWRKQFEQNPEDFRALYNFAARQFNNIRHYAGKAPSDLNIQDIQNIKKSMSGMNMYTKLAKKVPVERPYFDVVKRNKKAISKIAEKRIHQLKAQYAQQGKPIPEALSKLPECGEMDKLKEKVENEQDPGWVAK